MAAFRESIQNQTHVSLLLTERVISTKSPPISIYKRWFIKNTQKFDKNFVFSPLSIQIVLNMLAAGSTGPTHEKLLGFLKFRSIDELNYLTSWLVSVLFIDGTQYRGPKFSFANGVWVAKSVDLKPPFKYALDSVFKATSKNVDFYNQHLKAIKEINEWAAKETFGIIKKILEPGTLDPLTKLIFANAMYFKGKWQQEFCAEETRHEFFFLLNGKSVEVPMMTKSRDKQDYYVGEFATFQVLRLPFLQGNDMRSFSMLIFLPHAKDGLPAVVKNICTSPGFIETHFPDKLVKVRDLRIPKFKLTFSFEASKILESMGLELPSAKDVVEFAGPGLPTKIFQKSIIEVNEEGTEVAAVCIMRLRGGGYGPIETEDMVKFVADHPFFFIIREDTSGTVFFVGQVMNPVESS